MYHEKVCAKKKPQMKYVCAVDFCKIIKHKLFIVKILFLFSFNHYYRKEKKKMYILHCFHSKKKNTVFMCLFCKTGIRNTRENTTR